ncbi:hypothetical protein GDO86_007435 [Hymenochirus boettgeri]|uniref:C3H1-type domain-containing protein n=1 Tax=Hymenochirus boettgeri TaxID=247094 RepID=A0A8T2IWJ4_9PIPI|nr:hypothetical protein GDO86_007435 [Hymenochirus boettgeri]
MARQKRKEDIEKGLQFIQSTIPFHGSEEDYEQFLQQLVKNLFSEGNYFYRAGDPKLALVQYTEGLNVADYATSEELTIPKDLLSKMYVNRSCCYYAIGRFEKSLEDSEKALSHDKENMRALYRKAKALDHLGRHQEAYGCISDKLLALVQDENVTELAQELVQKLGLKQRKAYKRPQQELESFGLLSNGTSTSTSSQTSSNSLGSLDDIDVGFPSVDGSLNDFTDCDIIGDELDSFLESGIMQTSIPCSQMPQLIPVNPVGAPLLPTLGNNVLPAPSPLPPASFGLLHSESLAGAEKSLYNMKLVPFADPSLDTLDSFDSSTETLDSLDTFQNEVNPLPSSLTKASHKQKSVGNNVNHLLFYKADAAHLHTGALSSALQSNPLAESYDFKQGCHHCYVRTGPKALDYTHREKLEHRCKRDLLLARRKCSENKSWLRIRPRPMRVAFTGPYFLCKDILARQDCKYGEDCTFAYYQEEIDVWNEERNGNLRRDQLFLSTGEATPDPVSCLLQEHKGIFTFLCQACFDSKPRVISKRNKENPNMCTKQHCFSSNKCLVHVYNSSTVRYSKIRPFQPGFQMELCRLEIQYGCLSENACNFAHSPVELSFWMLQHQSGITQEDIVQESEQGWKVVETKAKPLPKSLDMKMKFVCGQCLHNGREIEADRDGKYCTAKARHSWTKDKRVLLVMSKAKKKWVPVRSLPSVQFFPQHYEICFHIQNGKKCQYIRNCTFAHSTEEKDVWTFMKDNKVLDLQLVFDLCQKKNHPPEKEATVTQKEMEAEKQIIMPTDYADLMAGFHCYLCGKNSNSERQWQKHIRSEKHKDRVFTTESEDSTWKFRFPAGEFKLCDSFETTENCPEESNCPFAHGQEELDEWLKRRELLLQKVSKARKDMLLEPTDSDFGKYTFLLKDLA